MGNNDILKIEHTTPPGLPGIYRRLLLGRRAAYHTGDALPHFRATWKGARADEALVRRYCDACSLPYDGHLPVFYPHILASPIHLDMISRPEFPLSPTGAVHARNHLIQHAPMPVDQPFDVTCELATTRVLKQGLEFEITTTLSAGEKRYWESISANLIRGKHFGDPEAPSDLAEVPPVPEEGFETHTWEVPRRMGWRYARITGDFNPIHISRILAKFMGFRRDLIHGMWSAARCGAHLPPLPEQFPLQLDVLFKGPVYMESTSSLRLHAGAQDTRFELYCDDNPRPCIRGRAMPVDPDTRLVPEKGTENALV